MVAWLKRVITVRLSRKRNEISGAYLRVPKKTRVADEAESGPRPPCAAGEGGRRLARGAAHPPRPRPPCAAGEGGRRLQAGQAGRGRDSRQACHPRFFRDSNQATGRIFSVSSGPTPQRRNR